MDLAGVEVLQSLVGVRQRVFDGGQVDEAPVRQRHQLDQFGPGADQVADDVLLSDDHVDRRYADILAIADDIVAARRAGHREALGRGALLADEVDDRLRADALRQLQHGFDLVSVRLDQLVGAELASEGERGVGLVDHDHIRRAHGLQALDADMPQSAGADDHAGFSRKQVARRFLDGAVGREAGVGVGGDVLGR